MSKIKRIIAIFLVVIFFACTSTSIANTSQAIKCNFHNTAEMQHRAQKSVDSIALLSYINADSITQINADTTKPANFQLTTNNYAQWNVEDEILHFEAPKESFMKAPFGVQNSIREPTYIIRGRVQNSSATRANSNESICLHLVHIKTTDPTCARAGNKKYYCTRCGKVFSVKEFGEHKKCVAGTWEVVQAASISEPQLERSKCTQCGRVLERERSIIEVVTDEAARRGSLGRVIIPSADINVAIFSGSSQEIADAKDSANYISWHSVTLIADHNYQGFNNIKSLPLGAEMYIVMPSGVKTYTYIGSGKGRNIGSDLVTMEGDSITYGNYSYMILYTCNSNGTITYTMWN